MLRCTKGIRENSKHEDQLTAGYHKIKACCDVMSGLLVLSC